MESSEPQLEHVEKPIVVRTAWATESGVPGPVGLGATVLGLQRSAGNRAVVRWLGSSARRAPSGSILARAAGDPRAVKVQTITPAQADRMALADFEDFTALAGDRGHDGKIVTERFDSHRRTIAPALTALRPAATAGACRQAAWARLKRHTASGIAIPSSSAHQSTIPSSGWSSSHEPPD